MKKHLKTAISLLIISATIGAFWYYISKNPQVIDRLRDLSPAVALLLVTLYAIWFLALVLMTRFSLRVYDRTMGKQENLLFNAYSSLINFFGPGQSGPIFRGVYLKKLHNITVKQYLFTTLIYYGFYAVISACLLLIGSRPWWQTVILMLGAAGGSFVIIRWYRVKKLGEKTSLNIAAIGLIFVATVLQLAAQTAIYGIELHASGTNASFGQILSYTGAANFSLFVALTPGAIGIREAFLLFSQNLHHIGETSIVAASVIDRAIYLVFLALLFILVVATHAKDKLHIKQLKLKEQQQ